MKFTSPFRRRKTLSPSSRSSSSLSLANEESPLSPSSSTRLSSIPPFVIRATAIASLGGILFGYDMGVISGALPQLTNAFALTENQQQLVVGMLYLGGGIGAAVGGTLCDYLGRRLAILVTDGVFVMGALLFVVAHNISHLILGRIVMGFGIAVSGIADVAYLNELAPKEWRGAVVSVNEACISLGFLLAYIAGNLLQSGWRVMFGISGLVALIQLVGTCIMPESPLWLQEQGRVEESQEALRIIYGDKIPAEELDTTTTHSSYESMVSEKEASSTCRHVTTTCRRYSKQAWIALFLSVAQQLSGQTNVLNYAPSIFSQFNEKASLSSTLYIGMVKFVVTALVIWRIEFLGRRFLLLSGMTVIVLGLLVLTLAFSMGGSVEDEDGEMIPSQQTGMWLALPGVLLVVMGYSASFGPLTWLLTSELFPTEIRGRALGVSTIVTYLTAFLVTSTFLSAQAWLGGHVFLLYAIFTVLGIVFVSLAIPDTGDKTVSEIEDELQTMWWWRRREEIVNADAPKVLESELT